MKARLRRPRARTRRRKARKLKAEAARRQGEKRAWWSASEWMARVREDMLRHHQLDALAHAFGRLDPNRPRPGDTFTWPGCTRPEDLVGRRTSIGYRIHSEVARLEAEGYQVADLDFAALERRMTAQIAEAYRVSPELLGHTPEARPLTMRDLENLHRELVFGGHANPPPSCRCHHCNPAAYHDACYARPQPGRRWATGTLRPEAELAEGYQNVQAFGFAPWHSYADARRRNNGEPAPEVKEMTFEEWQAWAAREIAEVQGQGE